MIVFQVRQSCRDVLARASDFLSQQSPVLDLRCIASAGLALALLSAATSVQAATTAGAMPGQFSVSATGGAGYSIPITLPPGVHGLAPSLALTYNSQAGSGVAGWGWSLAGLSAITRCSATIAEDGAAAPVTQGDTDDYCLDGQKLRLHGADGTYRTAIDGFSQITAHSDSGPAPQPLNGPRWFEVKTKDGLTYVYGGSSDSQQWEYFLSPTNGRANACGTVLWSTIQTYALTQIRDRSGNAVNFNYGQDVCSGDFWLSSITYSDRMSGLPGSITAAGAHEVDFSYADLPGTDSGIRFVGGAIHGHTKRLSSITIKTSGSTDYTYTLSYQSAATGSVSELTSVKQCAGSVCYAPTTIAWEDQTDQSGWGSTIVASNSGSDTSKYAMPVDVFGDGTTQFLYASGQGGYWFIDHIAPTGVNIYPYSTGAPVGRDVSAQTVAMPMRYKGDGTDSLLEVIHHASGADLWHILTFTPGAYPDGTTYVNLNTNIDTTTASETGTMVADLNGDGFDDFIYSVTLPNGDAGLYAYMNGTSGLAASPIKVYDSGVLASQNPAWMNSQLGGLRNGMREADFNGDGRADVFVKWGKVWWAMASSGSSSNPQLVAFDSIGDSDPDQSPLMLDANGDGLTDIAYVCAPTATSCIPGDWVIAVSTGAGFYVTDSGKTAQFPSGAMATDYNGDGRQDIMYPEQAGLNWHVFLSVYVDATASTPAYYGLSATLDTGVAVNTYPNPAGTTNGVANPPVLSMDFNGDGLSDLIGTDPSTQKYQFAKHDSFIHAVSSVDDGIGNSVQPAYKSIANGSSVYSAGGNVNYPTVTAVGPMYVVSSYVESSGANNGDAASYTMTYAYQGAAADMQGRGFLGFSDVQQTDSRTGNTIDTQYRQDFPYAGMPAEQAITNSSGTTLQDTINTFDNQLTSGTVGAHSDAYFPFIATSTTKTYGSGSDDGMAGSLVETVKTTSTYDSWGNPTLLVTNDTLGSGGSGRFLQQNTIRTFSENAANWCIGLPTSETIAKSYATNAATTPGTGGAPGNSSREVTYSNDYVNCRVNSKTMVANEAGMSPTETYTYGDAWGNATEVKVTDDNQHLLRDTLYDYSGTSGALPSKTTQKNPASGIDLVVEQTWDLVHGAPLTSTQYASTSPTDTLTTTSTYDGFGRSTSQTASDGSSSVAAYMPCPGSSACITGAAYYVDTVHHAQDGTAGGLKRAQYDSLGRIIETGRYVLGDQMSLQDKRYNKLGLVTGDSAPYFAGNTRYWTTTAYDGQQRVSSITAPAGESAPTGNVTSFTYNSGGVPRALKQVMTTSVPGGAPATQTVTKQYSVVKKVNEVDDAAGQTSYTYDTFGDVTSVTATTSNGTQTTSLVYDSLGHKTQLTDPDTGVTNYQYDALGELTQQTDANQKTITIVYDTLGRMVSRTMPGSDGNPVTAGWTYDTALHGAGRLASETDGGNFSRSYSYDQYGRLGSADTNIGGTHYVSSTSYDGFGRPSSVSYPATPAAPADAAPVSNAGGNQIAAANTQVLLDGSASSDPDSGPQPLAYLWSQLSGPANVGIDGTRSSKVNFSAATAGTYGFQLMVGDGQLTNTSATSVTILPAGPDVTGFTPGGPSTTGNYSVNWNASAGASSYTLFESTDGTNFTALPGSYSSPTAPLTGKGTGAQSKTYTYKVEGCLSGGQCGAYGASASIQVNLLPVAPTGMGDGGDADRDGTYNVSWNTVTPPTGVTAGSLVYHLQEAGGDSTGPTTVYADIWTGSTTASTLTHSVSHPGNGYYYYYYRVCAADANGCGPYSNVDNIHVVVRPGVPTSISATPASSTTNSFTVSWGAAASGKVTEYQMFKDTSSSFSTQTIQYDGSGRTTSAFALPHTGTWYFQVRACNQDGTLEICSGWRAYDSVIYLTGGGGGGGGCPPPPQQCQWMLPDDLMAVVKPEFRDVQPMGMQALGQAQVLQPVTLAQARPNTHRRAVPGSSRARLLALRRELLQRHSSLLSPTEQAAWKQQWHSNPAAMAAYAPRAATPGDAREAFEQASDAAVYRTGADKRSNLLDELQDTGADAGYQVRNADVTTTNFTVINVYDDHDNLEAVVDAQDPTLIYWQAETVDSWGHVTGETYGNNVLTTRIYDAATGMVRNIGSGVGSATTVQDMEYHWDGYGNLYTRQDDNTALVETLQYDGLNRLTSATVSGGTVGVPAITASYDASGNILSKSDAGTYAYDPAHAHRLASVTPVGGTAVTYDFDAAGNLKDSSNSRTLTWTADNRPSSIISGTNSSSFYYDPDGQRYQEHNLVNGAGSTTVEIGGLMEAVTPDGSTTPSVYRLAIWAGGKQVAVRTVQASGSSIGSFSNSYLHYDHLGSVDVITDATGTPTRRFSYDAFGRYRDPSTWAPLAGAPAQGATDRGYTSQQQLDGLGLIHMNGRVYDPALGQFVSADPMVQDLYNSQSLNRYAYVWDNPLRYTDPTGYCSVASDWAGISTGGLLGGGCGRDAFKTLIVDAWHFINHPAKVLEYTAPGIGNWTNIRISHSQTMQRDLGYVAMVVSVVVSVWATPAAGAAVYAGYEMYVADLNGASGLQIAEIGGVAYMSAYSTGSAAGGFISGLSSALKDQAVKIAFNWSVKMTVGEFVTEQVVGAYLVSRVEAVGKERLEHSGASQNAANAWVTGFFFGISFAGTRFNSTNTADDRALDASYMRSGWNDLLNMPSSFRFSFNGISL